VEETDLIILWGSNARETHPIFFHHVLKGVRNGAKLYTVDPRRTSSAEWADVWLGIDVGTDIALSNTIAREIIHAGLADTKFIRNATTGYAEYAASVEAWTLERGAAETGVPAAAIRELAHTYARADRAMICWTLGITEHHNAVDNVLCLINLALLTGHVGKWGSGLNPLRGQNNVQGGGDMGAIPNKFPGFQDIEQDTEARARFEAAWGCAILPKYGWHLTEMFHAMERGELTTLYVIGENPAQSEADAQHANPLLESLDCLVVQDMFLTRTAQMADVVLPASASWCESEGTVTNSERRVQRVRKALDPPGNARDDMAILQDLARRLGRDWDYGTSSREIAERAWNELRALSPMHRGMSYQRLEALGGIPWPCYDEAHPGSPFLHGRLWEEDPEQRGPAAPFSVVVHELPVDTLTEEFPIRLTTVRNLDNYNTGVQTAGYASPLRRLEALGLAPEDGKRYGVQDGEVVKVSSRRGSIEMPVRYDARLRPGLASATLHSPDEVEINVLTIEANDPKSGTAEFKAAAIRIDKLNGHASYEPAVAGAKSRST
jgi:predicted molibdopterin-dependent oxidoreductase YjgC